MSLHPALKPLSARPPAGHLPISEQGRRPLFRVSGALSHLPHPRFYVERDRGLYCREIESLVEAGHLTDVVWGNAESLNDAARPLGPLIPMHVWYASLTA